MTATKLRIDLKQGLLEVEGTDQFVREIYSDFKDRLLSNHQHQTTPKLIAQENLPTQQPSVGESEVV